MCDFLAGFTTVTWTSITNRVCSYSLGKKSANAHVAHGDWLADEVSLSPNQHVLHEILFRSGARWMIESEDIHFKWAPIV
jgi:hypothetical protein